MKLAGKTFPYNTPTTKEGYYYRKIFHELFPSENAAKTVKKWVPKWQVKIIFEGFFKTLPTRLFF